MNTRFFTKFVYITCTLGSLLGIWWVLSSFKIINPIFLPTPNETLEAFITGFQDGTLLIDIWSTMFKFIIAFFIAILLGTPLGILMGSSKRIYYAFEFLVEFFRSIPTTALFPFFILAFGITDLSKIAVAVWGASLIIIVNTMYGVHNVKKLRLTVAKNLDLTVLQTYRHIIFPDALPTIFSGYRIALSITLVIIIVTEMFIGAKNGLGYRIINAQLVYNTADMFASIIITGILGFGSNKIVQYLDLHLLHWKGK